MTEEELTVICEMETDTVTEVFKTRPTLGCERSAEASTCIAATRSADEPAVQTEVKIEIDVAEDPTLYWGVKTEQHTQDGNQPHPMKTSLTGVSGSKRFASHGPVEIAAKKSKLTAEATKKSNQNAATTLRQFLEEKKQEVNFEDLTPELLDKVLAHFYLNARTKTGELYRGKTLAALRYGMNRYLKALPNRVVIDIIRDPRFASSNESFQTALNGLKEEGKAEVVHTPAILNTDLHKLYTSKFLRTDTPSGLANKVQLDVRLYFFRKLNLNFEKMTKTTFEILKDPDTGKKFVQECLDDKLDKNRRPDDAEWVMYETGGEFCPVSSFEKYLSLLNPDCDGLWQYPKDGAFTREKPNEKKKKKKIREKPNEKKKQKKTRAKDFWFTKKPMGCNTLRNFLKRLSQKCGLSREYTNLALKATGHSILADANFAAVDSIMSVTGHRRSIVSALATDQEASVTRKREMSEAITSRINSELQRVVCASPRPIRTVPGSRERLLPTPSASVTTATTLVSEAASHSQCQSTAAGLRDVAVSDEEPSRSVMTSDPPGPPKQISISRSCAIGSGKDSMRSETAKTHVKPASPSSAAELSTGSCVRRMQEALDHFIVATDVQRPSDSEPNSGDEKDAGVQCSTPDPAVPAQGTEARKSRLCPSKTPQSAESKERLPAEATERANLNAATTFRLYLQEKEREVNFEDFTPESLDKVLAHFYLDARTRTGEMYRGKTLASLRYGINRFLKALPDHVFVDIIRDPRFASSCASFHMAMKELREEGKMQVAHTPAILSADLHKLYTSRHLRTDTSCGLAYKVQFDIRLYFFRGGNESFEKMTKNSFEIMTDPGTGKKFVRESVDEHEKRRRLNEAACVMFETGGALCPVASFQKYVSQLHPDCPRLWQYPTDNSFRSDEDSLFSNKPVGAHTLRQFMKRLSRKCGLSREYTNHAIKATGANILADANFGAVDIMAVTGYRRMSSLAIYQKTSITRKREMSEAITSRINPGTRSV